MMEHFGREPDWIAYPYGSWSREVERAAADAEYRGGVTLQHGWVRPPALRPLAAERLTIPSGLSAAGLAIRAAGLPA